MKQVIRDIREEQTSPKLLNAIFKAKISALKSVKEEIFSSNRK